MEWKTLQQLLQWSFRPYCCSCQSSPQYLMTQFTEAESCEIGCGLLTLILSFLRKQRTHS
jgi:hypothetical protein